MRPRSVVPGGKGTRSCVAAVRAWGTKKHPFLGTFWGAHLHTRREANFADKNKEEAEGR